MEEKELMEKAKINPVLIVVGVVLIIISAVIGWYIGGNTDVSLDNEEVKIEEKDDEASSSNNQIDLIDENSDKYVDISLNNDESIKDFIMTTDFIVNSSYRSAFLEGNNELMDEFVRAYVLSFYAKYAEDYHEYAVDGNLYFSTEFLNNEIKKVFSQGEYSFNGVGGYSGYDFSEAQYLCDESICVVRYIIGGGIYRAGYETNVISTRQDGDNTIYTLKDYYYEYEEETYLVYTSEGGELLCKNESCPEDIVGTYGDKLNTYEMTFDKDNRYVSSKKIN